MSATICDTTWNEISNMNPNGEPCKEADRLAEIAEQNRSMLKLAEELHEQYLRDGIVLLPSLQSKRFGEMIFEALSSTNEAEGLDANAIRSFIEDKWCHLSNYPSSSAFAPPSESWNERFDRYNKMILEALSSTDEADGLDVDSVYSLIEQRCDYHMPENHRVSNLKARRLVGRGKLKKIG